MSLPLSAIERIDTICDRFEAAWKAGDGPRIDDFLDGEVGVERDALLKELVRVEAHYRPRAEGFAGESPGRRGLPVVAGYEIIDELGRGGMGVVYRARQLRPNRLVALKMISAGVHAGPRELERFRREADAVAQLQDPHIVQVYEVGEQDGHPFFALEYVAGGSLDRNLAGTPQPPAVSAEFVERLALAIHHAHQRGIIHRDLKPANILLLKREDGVDGTEPGAPVVDLRTWTPKITDFGLAKLLSADGGSPTRSGEMLGTPSYMAPEQVGGVEAPVAAATDVYGLGAILYELLTGRPPFRGETVLETMLQVQTVEPVSPSRLQPRCPRDLVTICLKCLKKEPRERYVSALDLAEDLHRFLDGQAIRARPIGAMRQALKWTRRQPVVAGLIGLLMLTVLLGAGTGSWFWWQAERGLKKAEDSLGKERAAQAERVATLDRFRIALAHREWLANNLARAEELLDSCSDEQRLEWEWRYLDRLRHSALQTWSGHTDGIRALAVHPAGRQVVSAGRDRTPRVWDLETGTRAELDSSGQSGIMAVAYSRDGRMLATCDSQRRVKLIDPRTGESRMITYGGEGEVGVSTLAFDPSNRYLAMGNRRMVRIWDTLGQRMSHEWEAHDSAIAKIAFDPTGRILATTSREIKLWQWESVSTKPTKTWNGHRTQTTDLAYSADGKWLVSGGRDGMIRVHSLETGREEYSFDAHQLGVTSVEFSPDGERLASSGREGEMHVWDFKQRRKLFTLHGHSGSVLDLIYTPNGKHLISGGADSMVRVWNAEASPQSDPLPFRVESVLTAAAFGPGSRQIAWGDSRGRVRVGDLASRKEVFRFDAHGLNPQTAVASFAFSPDGRQLAWRQRGFPPHLRDLETGKEIALSDLGKAEVVGLAFSSGGQRLLGALWRDVTVRLCDLRTGEVLLSLPQSDQAVTHVEWSADARRVVTLEGGKNPRLWDAESGYLLGKFDHEGVVRRTAFSGDGRLLALGGVGGRITVWDLTTNLRTMDVTGHTSNLQGLAMSPDGRRLASSAQDSTVKLWDTRTGHEVLAIRTQLHNLSLLAFSPDGEDLVGVTLDNQLQIWSARQKRISKD